MTANTITSLTRIAALDYAVEKNGISADPTELRLVADAARGLGVDDVLVSVMVDEDAPEVVRIRAYARVATAVADRLVLAA